MARRRRRKSHHNPVRMHRRVHHRRRRARRNPSFGGLHFPSTNRLIGGVAAAVGGPLLGNMLFRNATGPMKSLGFVVGGLGVAFGARMLLGADAGEAAALVAVAVPVAGLVASAVPGGTSAGYAVADSSLAQLGALPEGFTETVSGYEEVEPSSFAFASDDEG